MKITHLWIVLGIISLFGCNPSKDKKSSDAKEAKKSEEQINCEKDQKKIWENGKCKDVITTAPKTAEPSDNTPAIKSADENVDLKIYGACYSPVACKEYYNQKEMLDGKKRCEDDPDNWTWVEKCDLSKYQVGCHQDDSKMVTWWTGKDGECLYGATKIYSRSEVKNLLTEVDKRLQNKFVKNGVEPAFNDYCTATAKSDIFDEQIDIGIRKGSEHLISEAGFSKLDVIVYKDERTYEMSDLEVDLFDLSCEYEAMDDMWITDRLNVALLPIKVYADENMSQFICLFHPGQKLALGNSECRDSKCEAELGELVADCGKDKGFFKDDIDRLYPKSKIQNR